MAILTTRLTNTGTYFVNGSFDEVSVSTSRVTTNTVYASLLDEVSFNPNSGVPVNVLSYSQNFSTANWANFFSTTVSATTATKAPDGTYTAFKLSETADANFHFFGQNISSSYIEGYFSYYAKAAERNFAGFNNAPCPTIGTVDLTTGAININGSNFSNCTSTYVGDGWWRIGGYYNDGTAWQFAGPAVAASSSNVNYTGTAGSGIYIWGVQFEPGNVRTPSVYVGTTASSAKLPAPAMRIINPGDTYITNQFDEVSGIS